MEPILAVYHLIRRTIRHLILDKHIGANDKIPTEKELADPINVNRMIIRQVLWSLVDEGLLIRRQGDGTFFTGNEELIQGISLKYIGLNLKLLLPLEIGRQLKKKFS